MLVKGEQTLQNKTGCSLILATTQLSLSGYNPENDRHNCHNEKTFDSLHENWLLFLHF